MFSGILSDNRAERDQQRRNMTCEEEQGMN